MKASLAGEFVGLLMMLLQFSFVLKSLVTVGDVAVEADVTNEEGCFHGSKFSEDTGTTAEFD